MSQLAPPLVPVGPIKWARNDFRALTLAGCARLPLGRASRDAAAAAPPPPRSQRQPPGTSGARRLKCVASQRSTASASINGPTSSGGRQNRRQTCEPPWALAQANKWRGKVTSARSAECFLSARRSPLGRTPVWSHRAACPCGQMGEKREEAISLAARCQSSSEILAHSSRVRFRLFSAPLSLLASRLRFKSRKNNSNHRRRRRRINFSPKGAAFCCNLTPKLDPEECEKQLREGDQEQEEEEEEGGDF